MESKSDYNGALPLVGDFDVSGMMVFEDQYPYITPITAKEGKTQWGLKEDHFCNRKYHVMYGLSKRGDNSMLMQLRKLSTFAKFEIRQVSSI